MLIYGRVVTTAPSPELAPLVRPLPCLRREGLCEQPVRSDSK